MDMEKPEDWPRDEEYDALNDETFGDDGDDFNWDAAQSLPELDANVIASFQKTKTNGRDEHEPSFKQGVYRQVDEYEPTFDKEIIHNYEEDFDNVNALEESISRLVMDEFDDEEEEEAMKSKLRRLGGTGSRLNTYFMPPQVVNKHLHWLMDKELPGGNSLFGSSVWSMHPVSSPAEKAAVPSMSSADSIRLDRGRLNDLSSSTGPDAMMGRISINNMNSIDARVPPNLGSLLGGTTVASSSKPVFKTVEEIERELLEGPPSPLKKINNTDVKLSQRPRVITAEELEREMMESSAPPTQAPSRATPAKMQQQGQGPSAEQLHRHGTPSSPSIHPQAPMPGSPTRPPPGMMPPHFMMQRMPPPPHPSMVQNPAAFAQMMANAQMQPPHIAAALQHHIRMIQMNPQLRGRVPFMMPMPNMPRPMGPGGFMMPMPNQGQPVQMLRQMRMEDPYRGLMNEKDKQRLRNIAIIQLQNDHPYTTDYYFLMFKVRHGASDPQRQRDCLLKLYPRRSDENSNRNNYQPAHFENSLGKLQAVSALAPKKAIDTVIRVVDSGPTNRSGMKAYRYLLLEVERLYECLLKIQESDIRKTLLLNADESILQLRMESERKVKEFINPPQKLAEILSVHKGKMLVSRLMPLLDLPSRFCVLAHMIRMFPEWAMPNKLSEVDKTYPYLKHCIFSGELAGFICCFNSSVPRSVYDTMCETKLGISLIVILFHRAECLIQNLASDDEKGNELKQLYMKEVAGLIQSFLGSATNVASPQEMSPNILKHVERWGFPVDQILPTIRAWELLPIPQIQ